MLLNLLRSSGWPPNEGLLGSTGGENPGASGLQAVGDLGLWVPEPPLPPHCPLSWTWSCSPLPRKSCPAGHPRGALWRGRGRQGLLHGRPSFCLDRSSRAGSFPAVPSLHSPRGDSLAGVLTRPAQSHRHEARLSHCPSVPSLPTTGHPQGAEAPWAPRVRWESQSAPESSPNFCLMSK